MRRLGRTIGAVDLHFHGAFGVDLMTADTAAHDELSAALWKRGLAGYCATTLSAGPEPLVKTVERLGRYIRSKDGKFPGAHPLGIHLEGPFLSPHAAGAHPTEIIRPLTFTELELLWEKSRETLKILTIAPETLTQDDLKKLARWAKPRGVILSLGHSKATEEQSAHAFDEGFSGVTHAWNAMSFHHRAAGPLGAALGRKDTHVEVILDGIHVTPTVVRWVLKLHPNGTCFVSDCAPAAATTSGWHAFGDLQTEFRDGACRLGNGSLAGGGVLLTEGYGRWLVEEAKLTGTALPLLWKKTSRYLTQEPLLALGLSAAQIRNLAKTRSVEWRFSPSEGVQALPRVETRA